MWVIILAVFALIVVWVGGFVLMNSLMAPTVDGGKPFPLWLAITLTVLIILLVAGWYAFKRWRAVMKAKALEREIMKQAEQQALNARPDRRAEIIELQMQVQRGLSALKTSRLGGVSGSAALYQLPWYVIIGPPGAGKTTALKASGLSFPFLDQQGGGVRGIGGTRNCDWWFTNEAILLDTAGRYATEADDHEEWLAFLGMLKRFRSRKPINGVLVAIAVSDLMEATEEQIDTYAKKLRARIDEVMTRLQMVVPVYVMFTKVDLVAGFVEFWNDLRKSERGQIWGATFPLAGSDTRDAAKSFEGEFDGLVEAVHARAIKRIGGERQMEARQKIFQFPIEYQALRANLSEFINGLFQKNNFQETPIFRGIYFTSGTQEGKPIDRVIGGMMRAFNIAPAAAAPQPQGEAKSYFVTDVFRKVVFPDKDVAARTKGEVRRQLINRLAFAAALTFLAALLVIPAVYVFANNRQLVTDTTADVLTADGTSWSTLNDPSGTALANLDAVGIRVRHLDSWSSTFSDRPVRYRFVIMYTGNDLLPGARKAYQTALQNAFAAPTQAWLEKQLTNLTPAQVQDVDTYGEKYNELRAYMEACGTVDEKGAPRLEDARQSPSADEKATNTAGDKDFGWETETLTQYWLITLGMCDKSNGNCGAEATVPADLDLTQDKTAPEILAGQSAYTRMNLHVEYYLQQMRQFAADKAANRTTTTGIPWWTCNQTLVKNAQDALNSTTQLNALYNEKISTATKHNPQITRSDDDASSAIAVFPPTSPFYPYISSVRDGTGMGKTVPGAYTYGGWVGTMRHFLTSKHLDTKNLWVLGKTAAEQAPKSEEAEIAGLKSRYFQEYARYWTDFLKDLQVAQARDNKSALLELQALGTIAPGSSLPCAPSASIDGGGLPYARLFKILHCNTVLDPAPVSAEDQAKAGLLKQVTSAASSKAQTVPGASLILGDAGAPAAAKPPDKTDIEVNFDPLASFGYAPPPAKEGDPPAATSFDAYMTQVVAPVVADLSALNTSRGKGMDPKQVQTDFNKAMDTTVQLLATSKQNVFTRPILEPLLENPIALGLQGVLNDLGGVAGGKWEPEVWKKWYATLDNKYPFTDSVKDASLQDFQTFFAPNTGLLWAFYNTNLATMLDKSGTFDGTTTFEPSVQMGQSVGFTPDFLRCYNRGLQITSDTFPASTGAAPGAAPAAAGASIEFDINLHSVSSNVSEVTFAIDGVEQTYQNTPEQWVHVTWPAAQPKSRGGLVRIRGFDGLDESIERPGDFGFFRLLDAAISIENGTEGGRRNGAPTIVVTWPLRSQSGVVRMDIKPSTQDSVFSYHAQNHQRVFRGYWCPRIVATPVR